MDENREPEELYERTTKKSITQLPTLMNEKDYAQWKYDHALSAMLANPSAKNRADFEAANKFLYEVQDKYRIGGRLLIQKGEQKEADFSRKIIEAHISKGKTKPGKMQAVISFFRQRLMP